MNYAEILTQDEKDDWIALCEMQEICNNQKDSENEIFFESIWQEISNQKSLLKQSIGKRIIEEWEDE